MFAADNAHEVVADITAARKLHLHNGSLLHLVVADRNEELPNPKRDKRITVRVVGIGVTRDSVVTVNALANAPGLAGLVDDQHTSGGAALAHHVVHRQRRQPPQVDDPRTDSKGFEPARHPQAHPQPVAERDDRQVRAVTVDTRAADGRDAIGGRIGREPPVVAVIV